MYIILLFTVIGFLSGLAYTIVKRKIHLSPIITGSLFGMIIGGIWKASRVYSKSKRKRHF